MEQQLTQNKVFYAYNKPRKFTLLSIGDILINNDQDMFSAISASVKALQSAKPRVVVGPRATVAGTLIGDKIHFGISICSSDDPFDKNLGRKLAAYRMDRGYGEVLLMDVVGMFKDKEKDLGSPLSDDMKVIMYVQKIASKIGENPAKYMRKIETYKKENPEDKDLIANLG